MESLNSFVDVSDFFSLAMGDENKDQEAKSFLEIFGGSGSCTCGPNGVCIHCVSGKSGRKRALELDPFSSDPTTAVPTAAKFFKKDDSRDNHDFFDMPNLEEFEMFGNEREISLEGNRNNDSKVPSKQSTSSGSYTIRANPATVDFMKKIQEATFRNGAFDWQSAAAMMPMGPPMVDESEILKLFDFSYYPKHLRPSFGQEFPRRDDGNKGSSDDTEIMEVPSQGQGAKTQWVSSAPQRQHEDDDNSSEYSSDSSCNYYFCEVCERRYYTQQSYDFHVENHRRCRSCNKLLSNINYRLIRRDDDMPKDDICEGCREIERRARALARGATETIVRAPPEADVEDDEDEEEDQFECDCSDSDCSCYLLDSDEEEEDLEDEYSSADTEPGEIKRRRVDIERESCEEEEDEMDYDDEMDMEDMTESDLEEYMAQEREEDSFSEEEEEENFVSNPKNVAGSQNQSNLVTKQGKVGSIIEDEDDSCEEEEDAEDDCFEEEDEEDCLEEYDYYEEEEGCFEEEQEENLTAEERKRILEEEDCISTDPEDEED